MKYTYKLIYPNGQEVYSEYYYDSESVAQAEADYDCSCFSEGAEIMSLMGDRDEDIIDGDCEPKVIYLEDDDPELETLIHKL